MYNMPVFSSNDVYSSHVSVMNEWNKNYFVTKTFMKFGSVIIFFYPLKMWPNLLDQTYISTTIHHFWYVFGIIVLLEHPTATKSQSSADELMVKNLENILLLHYSIYFL